MMNLHPADTGMSRFKHGQFLRLLPGRWFLAWLLLAMAPMLAASETSGLPVAEGGAAMAEPESRLSEGAGKAPSTPSVHRVSQGDTLWDLAGQYYGNALKWPQIQKINGLKDADYLKPGTLVDLTPQDAFPLTVRYLNGDVWTLDEGRKQRLEEGATVQEGMILETGRGAALTLKTSDGSQIVVPSNTRVVVNRGGELGIQLALDKGEVDARVVPRDNKNRPFNIETASGVLGVRGTRFVAEATDQATLSSVYEGSVAAQTGDQLVERAKIRRGEGARAGNDGRLDVVDLLSEPEGLTADTMVEGELVATVLPRASAAAYRAVLTRDEAGEQTVAAQRSDMPRLVFEGIPEGEYFLKVAAIDSLGVVGYYAQKPITHRSAGVSVSHKGDAWQFNWQRQSTDKHALEMAMSASFDKVAFRYKPVSSGAISLRNIPETDIYWRVIRLDDEGSIASVIDSGRLYAPE